MVPSSFKSYRFLFNPVLKFPHDTQRDVPLRYHGRSSKAPKMSENKCFHLEMVNRLVIMDKYFFSA